MKKQLWSGLALLALTALVAAGMTAIADPPQELQEMIVYPDNGGDPCICPAVYAPVACWNGGLVSDPIEIFSNSCVAGCNGFTNCKPYDPPEKG